MSDPQYGPVPGLEISRFAVLSATRPGDALAGQNGPDKEESAFLRKVDTRHLSSFSACRSPGKAGQDTGEPGPWGLSGQDHTTWAQEAPGRRGQGRTHSPLSGTVVSSGPM